MVMMGRESGTAAPHRTARFCGSRGAYEPELDAQKLNAQQRQQHQASAVWHMHVGQYTCVTTTQAGMQ